MPISDILIRLQVSGVAFDSYWSAPNTDGTGESIVYQFGSKIMLQINYIRVAATKNLCCSLIHLMNYIFAGHTSVVMGS